ncbi:ornithine carbamoyltransferase [Candidatus Woesearchaeota archaeon]|nr:ornithine carbamoyltransferase [Candidatus Woesearchaeota archaeon]
MDKDLIDLSNLKKEEIEELIESAADIKKNPDKYNKAMDQKTLLMIFAKPSLRTRVSFETGMTRMGGHAIYYDISTSPMGKGETISDTAQTVSGYVDIIMARLFAHKDMEELSKYSKVPVINGLTDFNHPCQILSDLLTIREKKGEFNNLKLAYLGDANNNVTHSLLYGCAAAGINISVGCPEEHSPKKEVVEKAKQIATKEVIITHNAEEAAKDADVIYTDSWMSYHIPADEKEARMKVFMPYQVNKELMKHAKPDAVFMNCLPALRGMEQTADVIDGKQSIVFDQAENRMHMQNAIMLKLLK